MWVRTRAKPGANRAGRGTNGTIASRDPLVAEESPSQRRLQDRQQGQTDRDAGDLPSHFAAADPRVACAVGYAPVTDLAALSEFKGAENAPLVRQLAPANHADQLAARAIWITIGATDSRVDTDSAIATARAVTAAAVAQNVPDRVSLSVLPSPGHTTPAGFAEQSAASILHTLTPGDSK